MYDWCTIERLNYSLDRFRRNPKSTTSLCSILHRGANPTLTARIDSVVYEKPQQFSWAMRARVPCVYANRMTKTGTTGAGEEVGRETPFLKGYAVFNVEQIETCPTITTPSRSQSFQNAVERIDHAEVFFASGRGNPPTRVPGLLYAGRRLDPGSANRGFLHRGEIKWPNTPTSATALTAR